MLDERETIDMEVSQSPGVTMLIIQDMVPWPNPDDEERFDLFKAKLAGYADYVASEKFAKTHPTADRTMVLISVLTLAPPSLRMKAIKNVNTPGNIAYEILVRFVDDGMPNYMAAVKPTKPWWKFW